MECTGCTLSLQQPVDVWRVPWPHVGPNISMQSQVFRLFPALTEVPPPPHPPSAICLNCGRLFFRTEEPLDGSWFSPWTRQRIQGNNSSKRSVTRCFVVFHLKVKMSRKGISFQAGRGVEAGFCLCAWLTENGNQTLVANECHFCDRSTETPASLLKVFCNFFANVHFVQAKREFSMWGTSCG